MIFNQITKISKARDETAADMARLKLLIARSTLLEEVVNGTYKGNGVSIYIKGLDNLAVSDRLDYSVKDTTSVLATLLREADVEIYKLCKQYEIPCHMNRGDLDNAKDITNVI